MVVHFWKRNQIKMEYLPMAMWLGVYGTAIASVPAMARLKFMKGAF